MGVAEGGCYMSVEPGLDAEVDIDAAGDEAGTIHTPALSSAVPAHQRRSVFNDGGDRRLWGDERC